MSARVRTIVTNLHTVGRYHVIQTITTEMGPFKTRDEAERFAAVLRGAAPTAPPSERKAGSS
jgi:hypothetical protein